MIRHQVCQKDFFCTHSGVCSQEHLPFLKGVGLPIARRDCLTVSDLRQTSALVDLSIDFGDLPFLMCLACRLS